MAPNDLSPSVAEAIVYLREGGLGEIMSLTVQAIGENYDKIILSTDLALALCMLAEEVIRDRKLH